MAPWLLQLFLRCETCVTLLGIMLKCVLAHISTLETQQVSTNGNFALDDALLDAFVAAQEVGFDDVCEIVDGRPRGIDTLIQHVRGMVVLLTEHEFKELFRQYCRPGGPFVLTNGESMKQYVL